MGVVTDLRTVGVAVVVGQIMVVALVLDTVVVEVQATVPGVVVTVVGLIMVGVVVVLILVAEVQIMAAVVVAQTMALGVVALIVVAAAPPALVTEVVAAQTTVPGVVHTVAVAPLAMAVEVAVPEAQTTAPVVPVAVVVHTAVAMEAPAMVAVQIAEELEGTVAVPPGAPTTVAVGVADPMAAEVAVPGVTVVTVVPTTVVGVVGVVQTVEVVIVGALLVMVTVVTAVVAQIMAVVVVVTVVVNTVVEALIMVLVQITSAPVVGPMVAGVALMVVVARVVVVTAAVVTVILQVTAAAATTGGGYKKKISCGQLFYTATVFESTPPGTAVLQLNGTGTGGCPLKWSIEDNSLGRFNINPNSGIITIGGPLIRKFTRSAMEIRVRGTDCNSDVGLIHLFSGNFFLPIFYALLCLFPRPRVSFLEPVFLSVELLRKHRPHQRPPGYTGTAARSSRTGQPTAAIFAVQLFGQFALQRHDGCASGDRQCKHP